MSGHKRDFALSFHDCHFEFPADSISVLLEQKQLLVLRQHLGLDPDPVPTKRSADEAA